MRAFVQSLIYRWKYARALKHLGNAWYYMFKKNHQGSFLFPRGISGPVDTGDVWAEDVLQDRFWEMYTGKKWAP